MSRALADKTLAATLGSDQVREALKGKRYAVISIDFDHTRFDQKGNPVNAQVVLFNYTDDVSIHILTELSAFQVTSVSPVLHHPPLTTEELQQAIRLASADERVKPHLSPEMTATGIRMSDEDRDLGEPSRQVLVLFGHDDQREAELWSLVDLSADAVRDAGGARDAVRGKERST
jgi:hypothetical protein